MVIVASIKLQIRKIVIRHSFDLDVMEEKNNMKCEIERMEIIYTFYFFAFFEKVIKKLLTFCYW